jgi:hypothetical protein
MGRETCQARVKPKFANHLPSHPCSFSAVRDGYCRLHHPEQRIKDIAQQLRKLADQARDLERERDRLVVELEELRKKNGEFVES